MQTHKKKRRRRNNRKHNNADDTPEKHKEDTHFVEDEINQDKIKDIVETSQAEECIVLQDSIRL